MQHKKRLSFLSVLLLSPYRRANGRSECPFPGLYPSLWKLLDDFHGRYADGGGRIHVDCTKKRGGKPLYGYRKACPSRLEDILFSSISFRNTGAFRPALLRHKKPLWASSLDYFTKMQRLPSYSFGNCKARRNLNSNGRKRIPDYRPLSSLELCRSFDYRSTKTIFSNMT